MSNDKRVTIEKALGDWGFLVVWSVTDHCANVMAYEITAQTADGNPMFNRLGWQTLPDPVESYDHAESYLDGFIKWDGCSELDQGCPHWCGANGFKKHCDLLRYLHDRAFQLMGREPEESWPG